MDYLHNLKPFWLLRFSPLIRPSAILAGVLGVILLGCARQASAAPANDNFANAIVLNSGTSQQVTGTNINATFEAGEPFHDGLYTFNSVWYSWTPSTSGFVVFTLSSNDFDTVLAVYTGSSVSALTAVVGDGNDTNLTSQVSFVARAGVTYSIAVDGYDFAQGHFTLSFLQNNTAPPPVITSATSVTTPAGLSFNYQITATNQPSVFSAGYLPSGLTLNTTTGLISGTPQDKGTLTVGITATNIGGTGTSNLTITVADYVRPKFFTGETLVSNNVHYLALPNGNIFGYYAYLTDPRYLYHMDMGYEYIFNASDGHSGVYFYDFKSGDFFYTSPTFPFPYLYDFTLKTVLYYFPNPDQNDNPGRYNTNGVRYFYRFDTGVIITR